MGLLDDAIREHLELKRRRGADPAEVARSEQEALGPVRRERESADAEHGDAPEETSAVEATAVEPVAAVPLDAELFEEDIHSPEREAEREAAYEAQQREAATAPETRAPQATPDASAHVAEPRAHLDQPTTEYSVEDALRDGALTPHGKTTTDEADDAPEPNPDDVLEKTPEFLEETPEHDRLWFEQRPPRDFDFDG
jgi:hypothetical protein